jgi:hypothetical protein
MFNDFLRRLERPLRGLERTSPESTSGDSVLQVVLCRYNTSGGIERKRMPVAGTKYLAISHVWGRAEWSRIPGFDTQVLVSVEKAKFIAEQLRELVGEDYFWMDVLCINQRDKVERIAVTQHIPTIFRLAQRTIVVRDGYGCRDCCVAAIGSDSMDFSNLEWRTRWNNHHKEVHAKENFTEGILSRLWVLQEIVLSDTVQFTRCHAGEAVSDPEYFGAPDGIAVMLGLERTAAA